MAAPADDGSTATAPLLVRMKKPLPRAIQLAMAISSASKSSTTTASKEEEIGDHDRPVLWFMLVSLPSMCIAAAAACPYIALSGDDGNHAAVDELISRPGGFGFVAAPALLCVYMAVLVAAWPHLCLFAPRTPYAAAEAFVKAGMGVGGLAVLPTIGVLVLSCLTLNQAWPLLVAWTFLLGLLVASAVALWLCLLRTYGGDDAGGEKNDDGDNSGAEAVVDGLAYLYSRLLYEFAVWFYEVADADADAAGGQQQQLDAHVAALV